MPEPWQRAGFGLYVHWPYCQAKCPYCDFNSHVVAKIDQSAWLAAYESEIARLGRETEGRVLRSIFFGGGTPSLMDAHVVAGVLDAASRTWTLANDCEITLEANPSSVEAGRFRAYRAAGVNRVSLGVQALNDADLRALGRLHSVDEALTALDVAKEAFERVSFDLIYARQDQTLSMWDEELRRALSFDPDHLSLYQLTIEEGTAFGDRFERGTLKGLPNEDCAADMYELTQDLCSAAGLPAYEVSNHAVPGNESQHNMIYWQSGDWAAIGPGGHGRLSVDGARWATATIREPLAWLKAVRTDGNGELAREALSGPDVDAERVMMGLRTRLGLEKGNLSKDISNNINRLVQDDVLIEKDGRISIARSYWPILNEVLRQILTD